MRNIPRPRLRLSDLVLFIFRDGCQPASLAKKLTELGAGVDGCLGGVVGGQVLQVLLSRPRCHAHELVAPMRCVLRIDHFGQQELCEGAPLGEDRSSWDWRTKHWHVFAARHGNAVRIWFEYKDKTKPNC